VRTRWTAWDTLVAEQQFWRTMGYRDLAKLVIAIERGADRVKVSNTTTVSVRSRCCLTANYTWSPPPNFCDDPSIFDIASVYAHEDANR
jgi:hypothetical protein